MLGKIVYISNTMAHVEVIGGLEAASNLMNMHVVFEDGIKMVLGEVEDISETIVKVKFLGELNNGKFLSGVVRKPNLNASVRVITTNEMRSIVGEDGPGNMLLGFSPLYEGCQVSMNINDFFSNHFAIFGNTGSGKSWGVAKLIQNIFNNQGYMPYKSNIFIFDAYGEYHNAFKHLNSINPNYNFKFYTTNENQLKEGGELLRIPIWLLDLDDLALLLDANEHSQLPILERTLTLAKIFAEETEEAKKYKNFLIAKAIMNILYTSQTSLAKRNDIFTILNSCSTPEFNLEAPVQGLGYTRKFRECFIVDKQGEFTESILVTQYVASFIDTELEEYEPRELRQYSLKDLEKAFEFTLISEGLLRNEKLYNEAITLKVRLHTLVIGEDAKYFDYPTFITKEQYITSLVAYNGSKAQIINFNLEDITDSLAKVIVKIYSRMFFEFTKGLKRRASIPFHIFLEESHRYVQEDRDKYLLGYNIFERIAKEGRKYGLIISLISQRPVELSDTVIAQCSNFIIFKMTHPRDLEYITKMLPNISNDIIEKQKTLQPGTCVVFGKAFKIPMIVKMDPPSPVPESSNCDVYESWKVS
jgi:DNA helicase HerA-like ATPase